MLKFSLGFGPHDLLAARRRDEYCLCRDPARQFVKMIGQDDGSEPDPVLAAQPNSFAVKPLWARAFIVVAGPLGNLTDRSAAAVDPVRDRRSGPDLDGREGQRRRHAGGAAGLGLATRSPQ